jgi:hypothetical protein
LNEGAKAARGMLVGLLDQDDLWRSTKLEQHARCFEKHAEVDVTFSWSRLIDEQGREMALHTRHWRGAVGFRKLLEDYVVGNTSSIVLRRSAFESAGGFDTGLPRCHDLDLLLRIARQRADNIRAVPEELTLYRRHPGQMSRDWAGMRREWETLLAKYWRLAPEEMAAVEPGARSNMSRYFACLAYEGGEYGPAWEFVTEALRAAPGAFWADPRNWKVAAAVMAGRVLPGAVHGALERLAGIERDPAQNSRCVPSRRRPLRRSLKREKL